MEETMAARRTPCKAAPARERERERESRVEQRRATKAKELYKNLITNDTRSMVFFIT